MWIKRQEGYCLKEIAGVHYLLPYGQKVADQRKGIVLNETGVFLWNELQTSMTDDALAEKLVHHYLRMAKRLMKLKMRFKIRLKTRFKIRCKIKSDRM